MESRWVRLGSILSRSKGSNKAMEGMRTVTFTTGVGTFSTTFSRIGGFFNGFSFPGNFFLRFYNWLLVQPDGFLANRQQKKVADKRQYERIYSHSIVAGGLELMSYTTRLIPLTLLMISLDIFPSKL